MLSMKRRAFLKLAVATTAVAALGPRLVSAKILPDKPSGSSIEAPDAVKEGVTYVNSLCLMCQGRCGIRAKVKDGVVIKIDGNPYHPSSYDYVSKGDTVTKDDLKPDPDGFDLGSTCPKGAAGIATLYSPARLLHPVKRAGKRGERKWKRISWEQGINEIVEGGNLFGEGQIDGLRAIRSSEPIGAADSGYLDEAPPTGYGPKRNQLVWWRGRSNSRQVWRRFTTAYGTCNHQSHWDLCELTRQQIRGKMLNGGYDADFLPDLKSATYLISLGSSVFDAGFAAQTIARHLSKYFLRRPGTKAVHVNPILTKGGGRMHEWAPIKPGTDAYFLMGMIRSLIENNLHKKDYLSRPNKDAAAAGGYVNWTDATYLVNIKEPKTFVKTGTDYTVLVGGQAVAAGTVKGTADIEGSTATAKAVFTMLKERAMELSMDQYNEKSGLAKGTIERITREWATSERPSFNTYKGPGQQCNGSYNEMAVNSVQQLVGIIGTKGGMSGGAGGGGGGGLAVGGAGKTVPVDVSKDGDVGVRVCRGRNEYAGKKATATKQWYSLGAGRGDGISREIGTAFLTGYPYKAKAVMFVMNNPVFSVARAQPLEKALLQGKPPLAIGVNIDMNETDMLCDYVFPDTTYLERWGEPGFPGIVKSGVTGIRQPVIGNIADDGTPYRGAYPDIMCSDDFHIELGKKLGLPNFGKGGGIDGKDINDMKNFWNQHFSSGGYKDFKPNGVDRNADFWQMGGLFKNPGKIYTDDGKHTLNAYKGLVNFYPIGDAKEVAAYKNAMTGKYFEGIPVVRESLFDNKEQPLKFDESTYPYRMITYKPWQHTQSRTANNLWLMSLQPENACEINAADGAKLGVKTGDYVIVEGLTPDYKPKMKVELTQRLRPGTVAVAHSFGHWEAGSKNFEVDGQQTSHADPRMGAGYNMARLSLADPSYPGDPTDNPTIGDMIGGSCHQYNHPVKITKA